MSSRDEATNSSNKVSTVVSVQEEPPQALDEDMTLVTAVEQPAPDRVAVSEPQVPVDLDPDDVELLTRFLVGGLVFGGDELLKRIRLIQERTTARPDLLGQEKDLEEETTAALLRYLVVGLVMRGQRSVVKGVRAGFYVSLGTTSWFLGKLNGLTDNRLTRPLRRPLEARLRGWGQATARLIQEGRIQEQSGRMVAAGTVNEIIDDMIDLLAQNPELDRVIRQVIGQQSVGMAGAITDNARHFSVTLDDVSEGLVRRLLGRTPRKALPPSPLTGKPQVMYAAEALDKGDKDDR